VSEEESELLSSKPLGRPNTIKVDVGIERYEAQ